jgi:hypothetical protein
MLIPASPFTLKIVLNFACAPMPSHFTSSRETLFLAAGAKLKLKPNRERMPFHECLSAALKSAWAFMLG